MIHFAASLLVHGFTWAVLIFAGVAFIERDLAWLTYATDTDRADLLVYWLVATTGSAAFSEVVR